MSVDSLTNLYAIEDIIEFNTIPTTKMQATSIKSIICLVVGIILLILGTTVAILWSTIFNNFFTEEFTLNNSSTIYGLWKETPVPMYLKIYLFNWTNPDVFTTISNEKPHFTQLGPYVYREIDTKVNEVWNDNRTVTFQRKKVWHFEESMSNGTLSDLITNLDPVVVTLSSMMKDKPKFAREIVGKLLVTMQKKLSITKSVSELLFDGYEDKLLHMAQKLNISTIPFTKFGWFYERNNSETYDGTFNMMTGENNLSELGMLKEWNFLTQTDYYNDSCGMIGGTNGDLWPPALKNETISMFVPDICTTLNLNYNSSYELQGLTGSKFISDETILDNGTKVLSRACYCRTNSCQPSGVLDISKCKFQAPAFVSLPHFYLADSSYINAVEGLNPSQEHEIFIVLEPLTGVPMQVKAKIQLNLLIRSDDAMSLFKNVRQTYMPMLWFSQEVELTSDYASKIKLLLILPTLGVVTFCGIAAIGILIVSIGIFIYIRHKWRGEEGQILLSRNGTFNRTNA